MNDALTNLLADFEDRLEDISNVGGINASLVGLFRKNLEFLKESAGETGRMAGLIGKIDTQLKTLDQIEKLPDFQDKYEKLREQSVVLIVGAFEVFITDIFKLIGNDYPSFIKWSEKDKKVAIDIELFKEHFTLGDAFVAHLENKQYSFQDLRSIVKACKDYLGIEVVVEDGDRNNIIKATSYRHLIVHRNSTVDRQFLHQTRRLTDLQYKEGDRISISEDDFTSVQESFVSFAGYLINVIIQRED